MEKLIGIILVIASLLFTVAAFTPTTARVVTETNVQLRAEILGKERNTWILVNILFMLGSIVASAGLILFAVNYQGSSNTKLLSYLVPACFVGATGFWLYISTHRITSSPEILAQNLLINSRFFLIYTLLSQVALIICGFVLLQGNYSSWLGWGVLIMAGVSLLAYAVFKDMPPFAHYVPLLYMGIMLMR